MYIRSERFRDVRLYYNKHGDNMSLLDVAERSGVDKSFISRAENDDSCSLGADKVAKLAKFYGVSCDYLLGVSDVPHVKDATLESAMRETGLSYQAIANIKKTHQEIKPEAFEALEHILTHSELSHFLCEIALCKMNVDECRIFSEQLITTVKDAVANNSIKKADGKPSIDHITALKRSIENELWRFQYLFSELMKEYLDFDNARQVAVDCRNECDALLNDYRGDSDAE